MGDSSGRPPQAGRWHPLSQANRARLHEMFRGWNSSRQNTIEPYDQNKMNSVQPHVVMSDNPRAMEAGLQRETISGGHPTVQRECLNNLNEPQGTKGIPAQDETWITAIEKRFAVIAGDDGKISFAEFKKAIDVKEEFFAKKYFSFFDLDGSGEIEMAEFIQTLRQISQQTDIDKLRFLFRIFDTNGDGVITSGELKVVLGACVSESSLRMSEDQLDQLVSALMRAADTDKSGTITFEELKTQFEKYPMLVENLAISPSNWLKLHHKRKKPSLVETFTKKVANLVKNKKPLLFLLILHTLVSVACFVGSAVRYRTSNGWVIVARGCGMTLNYHGAVLALSMARRSLTYLRNTQIGRYLPVDDHVEVHKVLGVSTVVLGLIHTVCHLANIGVVTAAQGGLAYWEYLLTTRAGVGWVSGSAYITGDLLTLVLVVMALCSLPIVRKSGKFELFYWTHLLYNAFWILLLLHGPIFWMWFLVPGLILVGEWVYALCVRCYRAKNPRHFSIIEANLLPSKVTHLVITRPSTFRFRPGDYLFIRIPSISKWEWHPFSISSAPEQEGILWLHIRSLGNWTNRLYDLYDSGNYLQSIEPKDDEEASSYNVPSMRERRQTQPDPLHSATKAKRNVSDRRKVVMDGPYGSAAVRMGDTNHAVLIAGGIGVTPFASVLQSLLTQHRRAARDQRADQPRYANSSKLKKIDFIWVNRQANDFEWFIRLLTQLELEETRQNAFDRFLDLHLYMTAAKSASDLKGVGLQMALELVHQEAQHDIITGLRTRTKAGRPNWKEIFQEVKREKRGSVHVYFCGSPALAKIIKDECDNFSFRFSHSF